MVPRNTDTLFTLRNSYDYFFASRVGMSVDIPMDLVDAVEKQLNMRPVNLAVIKGLFSKVKVPMSALLQDRLAEFLEELVDPTICAECGATRLINLTNDTSGDGLVTVKSVIKEVLGPHIIRLRNVRTSDPSVIKLNGLLESSIEDFFIRNDVPVPTIARGVQPNSASIKQKRKHVKDGKYKGKKIHLHKGHHFVIYTYSHPTWCGHCGGLLWGIVKQGWKCIDCGFDIHKAKDHTGHQNCHRDLDYQCPGHKVKRRDGDAIGLKRAASKAKSPSFKSKRGIGSPKLSRSSSKRASTPNTPTSPMITSFGAEDCDDDDVDDDDEEDDDDDDDDDDDEDIDTAVEPVAELDIPPNPSIEEAANFYKYCDPATYKGMDKKERSRQEAIYEFIKTEKIYYRYLVIIEQVYLRALMTSKALSRELLLVLFGNISDLVKMHKIFCDALVALQNASTSVGVHSAGAVIFQELARLDSTKYAQWVSNQTAAHNAYKGLEPESSERNALDVCEAHPTNAKDRYRYTDFIAKPLQRVMKYPLLLKDILKRLPDSTEWDDERRWLKQASETATSRLHYLNKVKKEGETRSRLKCIADKTECSSDISMLESDWLSKVHSGKREILFDGELELKRTSDDKKEATLMGILLDDAMILLHTVKTSRHHQERWVLRRHGPHGDLIPIILLGNVHVTGNPHDKSGSSFYVIRNSAVSCVPTPLGPQMYELTATNKKEAAKWVAAIKAANAEFERKRPNFEKELESQYGNSHQPLAGLPQGRRPQSRGSENLEVKQSFALRRASSERVRRPKSESNSEDDGRIRPESWRGTRTANFGNAESVPDLETAPVSRDSVKTCCDTLLEAIDANELKRLQSPTDEVGRYLFAAAREAVVRLKQYVVQMDKGDHDQPSAPQSCESFEVPPPPVLDQRTVEPLKADQLLSPPPQWGSQPGADAFGGYGCDSESEGDEEVFV